MRLLKLAVIIPLMIAPAAGAQSQTCDAAAFRSVVSAASASISELHEKNNKIFQEKLQKLKAASGWSDADYVAKATPFVKDDVTASLDAANQTLLAKVQSFNGEQAGSDAGRCSMLQELKSLMQQVVANTDTKWQHLISKVTLASGETVQAGAH